MSGAAFADVPVSTYLALEASGAGAPARHEYWDGQVRAMTGASLAHNRANIALGSLLWQRLRGGPCEAFANDMRVKLSPSRYVYPDIVVACPPEVDATHRPESLLNPKVIFEVLSPSTTAVDRIDKLDGYRRVPSLTDYVLVDADAGTADHYARQDDGGWLVHTLGRDDTLRLVGLDVELPLVEVLTPAD